MTLDRSCDAVTAYHVPNQLHFTVVLLMSSSHPLFLSNIVANGQTTIARTL